MDNGENLRIIENSVGPKMHAEVSISRKEDSKFDEREWRDLVYEQILLQLPDNELKISIRLAVEERLARLNYRQTNPTYSTTSPQPLVEGSNEYAYRCFQRDIGDSTLAKDAIEK